MTGEPITRDRIDELLHFLPLFEMPGRAFIKAWGGGQSGSDNTISMPYPVYDEDVLAFFRLAGQPCWADYDYRPEAAAAMLADNKRIAQATLDEVRTMLTYCVRGERFSDGHWAAMLKSGKVTAVLRRLQILSDREER